MSSKSLEKGWRSEQNGSVSVLQNVISTCWYTRIKFVGCVWSKLSQLRRPKNHAILTKQGHELFPINYHLRSLGAMCSLFKVLLSSMHSFYRFELDMMRSATQRALCNGSSLPGLAIMHRPKSLPSGLTPLTSTLFILPTSFFEPRILTTLLHCLRILTVVKKLVPLLKCVPACI